MEFTPLSDGNFQSKASRKFPVINKLEQLFLTRSAFNKLIVHLSFLVFVRINCYYISEGSKLSAKAELSSWGGLGQFGGSGSRLSGFAINWPRFLVTFYQ
jgi:hypothetical protein